MRSRFVLKGCAVLPVSLLVLMSLGGCRGWRDEPRVVPKIDPVAPRRAYYSSGAAKRLLILETDGGVGIWNLLPTPRLFSRLRAGAIEAAFSPDGEHVATVSADGKLRWWRVDGKLQWTSAEGHPAPARAVAVSEETIVTGGEDGTIRFWHLDGTPIGEAVEAHDGPIVSVDLSAKGDAVSLGGDETVRLWKKPSSKGVYEPQILYRPDKRRYGANFQHLLRLAESWGWDRSLAFSPSGELVAAALYDRSIRLWDDKGRPVFTVEKAHRDRPVRSISFSPRNDLIASAGYDGTVRLWDLQGRQIGKAIDAHRGAAFSVSISPDGEQLVTTGRDDRVRVWRRDGTLVFSFPPASPKRISTLAVANGAPLLALAEVEGETNLFSFDGEHQAKLERDGTRPITALTFGPGDQALVVGGGGDGLVWRWGLDGKQRWAPLRAGHAISALVFDPSGRNLAVGTNPFQIWKGNRRLWEQRVRPADAVISIDFHPTGAFMVTGSVLGDLQVWNPEGKSYAYRPKLGTEVVGSVVITPAGDSFIATFGTRQTIVRELGLDLVPRGEPFIGHRGKIAGLAFSPAGRLVTGGEDGIIRFWSLPSRRVETIHVGLPIDQLGFWRKLLWVRAGHWLFFYEEEGTLVASLLLDAGSVLAFTPDGWYAATSASSQRVNVYAASGSLLPPPQAASRRSPDRVLRAIVDRADG